MKTALASVLIFVAAVANAEAQTTPVWDTSGNGLLNGTYYFREVLWVVGDNAGDLSDAIALYGQITFSGTGTYSINAVVLEAGGRPQNFTANGTYSIAASGHGFFTHPLSSGDFVYGLVSNDIFVGSSTEAGANDIFIAAKIPSPQGTVGSLRGPYTLAYITFPDRIPSDTYDALWQMSPDGAGNLGPVNLKAYIGARGSTAFTQTISNVKYIFSNGAANMQFPNSSTALLAGNEYLYLTQDGNFVFGGSPNGFDFFVGVRTPAPTGGTGVNGLYYEAGVDLNTSTLGLGYAELDSFYGALSAAGGSIVGHQRLLSGFGSGAIDYTYSDKYAFNPDNTFTNTFTQFVVGPNGVRIGLGIGPFLGISAAVPVAPFSGSGVYLNPTGVVNAASSAPFTAGLAPGELITLYGSGLAPDTKIAASVPFPTSLLGVQVLINGTPAPLYYVTPTQVSAVVPYGITTKVAQIQVVNNQTTSNAITAFTAATAPGIFTNNPVGGLGYAAALHPDFSVITKSSPAQPGEYIQVYLTGLGAVSPAIQDGDVGPSSPPSTATNTFTVLLGGKPAVVAYSGLAPTLAGLYQINVQVPAGLPAGDAILEISGPDADTAEALVPIGGTATGGSAVVLKPTLRGIRPSGEHKKAQLLTTGAGRKL